MKYIIFLSLLAFGILFSSCENERKEDFPDKLLGMDIQYKYANEREYNVKLEKEGLSYRYVSGSKPKKWWGPFPYHHATLDDDYQVVAWHEKDYDDYITLIIDLDNKSLFGSGIIKGEEVHFSPAIISKLAFNRAE